MYRSACWLNIKKESITNTLTDTNDDLGLWRAKFGLLLYEKCVRAFMLHKKSYEKYITGKLNLFKKLYISCKLG